jgi:predicted Zn-dependent protease
LPYLEPAERLAFLRKRLANAAKEYRAQYVRAIFDHLLNRPCTAEIEAELFTLLPQTNDAEDPTQRLLALVELLHGINDRLIQNRFQALMKAVPKQEALTRVELRKKQEENRKAARAGLAERLKVEAAKHAPELARWMRLERLYFETLIERDLKAVAAECWEVLGDKPIVADEDETPDVKAVLDDVFRERHVALVAYLATRPQADAALVERLLKYVDQGIAGEKEGDTWKLFKYRLLIALDRPKELEQALTQWMASGGREPSEPGLQSQWRLSLGFLLAEQGRIAEAIKLFEGVEKADELPPAAYRAVADWYLVTNRRAEHERSLKNIYRTMPEHHMSNALYYMLSPWQRGDGKLPSELDHDVLLMFAALFEKSGSPANYLYQLQQFYQASHDFRLLAVMVEGVLGHTPARAYPFLIGMGGVLNEIRDEATVDEIAAQLEKTRAKAKSVTDQRALDLLELQVRRRAAELKNQPGPHAEAALAAMKRAFEREWLEGETPLMADLLQGLGCFTQELLAKEQLSELQLLYRKTKAGSSDRLHIGHRFAQTLRGYAYPVERVSHEPAIYRIRVSPPEPARLHEAIDILDPALREFEEANKGMLPASANEALSFLVSLHQELRHYARGEKILLEQLSRPVQEQQAYWLKQQLLSNYHTALAMGGEVSLGKEAVLYQALETRLLKELATQDNNHRYAMFQLLTKVYRTAKERKLEGVKTDVREFAFKKFPALLALQTNNYDAVVGEVAQLVREILGPEEAIAFVLDRIENEPRWLRLNHQDAWSRHGDALARWRSECSRPAEVEARLLRVVLAELRRDLSTRHSRSRALYARGHTHYWVAKEAEFLKVAEQVLVERKSSNAAVRHIADYLYYSLQQYDKAIAALLDAHKAQILDNAGLDRLIVFLHEQKRFAESIPLLEPIVAGRPESLQHRVWLMHACFQTKARDKLLALLKDTDTFFRQKDRWTEEVLAQLGQSTLANELHTECIAYYRELIPRYERARRNRGIGDGVLSYHYANKARAHAGLKQLPEAVEAASGAIVSWGPHRDQRQHALNTLVQILTEAADLDAFVAYWDKKTAEDGKDSPIIRKALGQAFVSKKEHAKAIVQLRLAVDLQPNDTETHQLLVTACDQQQDAEGAIRQLLASVELSRRDIKLYEDLGKRLQRLDQSAEAERAFTSIVEMLPTESESHTALAELRQQQNRWPEAIQHWDHVARIRALEPTGLLKLAEAQIHEKQWDAARETVHKLRSRTWPARFGDVPQQVRQLERQLEVNEPR